MSASNHRDLFWLFVLFSVVAFCPVQSRAQDIPAPGTTGQQRVAIDSTYDQTSFGSRSFDINGLFALNNNINESGARLRLTGSWSWYRFVASEDPRTLASGRSMEGDLLAGYGISLSRLSLLGLAGVAITSSLDDPGISRTQYGAKVLLTAYAKPTDQSMAYARAQYSTISDAYELQMKAGLKVLQIGYLGPEVKFSGRIGDDERRIGPHLSGIAIGPAAISLSGGWLFDRQLGSGRYVSISVYAAF
jgi:hypothetical protein